MGCNENSEYCSLPEVTPDTSSVKTINSIDIKNVRIKEGVLIFDDRANQLYARMENLGVGIDGAFARRKSRLDVEIQMENLLFWQQGELLVKNVTLGLKSGMSIDRDSLLIHVGSGCYGYQRIEVRFGR